MKKIMFGNSLMLLGIAIMILAGLKVIYVGTLWVSFLLIIVGFVMATVKAKLFCPEIAGLFCRIAGLFCHDSRANLSLKPVCFGIAIS